MFGPAVRLQVLRLRGGGKKRKKKVYTKPKKIKHKHKKSKLATLKYYQVRRAWLGGGGGQADGAELTDRSGCAQ